MSALYEIALTTLHCHGRELPYGAWRNYEAIARDALSRMKETPRNNRLLIAHLHCALMDAVDAYKVGQLG